MNTIKTRNETITNDLPQKNDQFADQNDFYHFSFALRSIQTIGYFFHYYQKFERFLCRRIFYSIFLIEFFLSTSILL